MDEGESKSINADESSTEDIESECVHKSVHKEKYAKNEAEHEKNLVTDNPVIKEPSYFNILKFGKNLLNKLDATCKRSREKYYTGLLRTTTDCNSRSNTPLSNKKIQKAMHKFISE